MTKSTKRTASETATLIKKLLKEENLNTRKDAARLDELRRIISQQLSDAKGDGQAVQQWRNFLQAARKELLEQLVERVNHVTACRTLLGVLAASHSSLEWYEGVLQFWRALVVFDTTTKTSPLEVKPIRTLLIQEFVQPFADVQYFGLNAIAGLANLLRNTDSATSHSADRLLDLLILVSLVQSQEDLDKKGLFLPDLHLKGETLSPDTFATATNDGGSDQSVNEEESDSDSNSDASDDDASDSDQNGPTLQEAKPMREQKPVYLDHRRHRSVWTKAWLAVLRLPLSGSGLRRALRILPVDVLPFSPHPLRFAEIFMQAYSNAKSSVVIPVLALEGLFYLMTKHGLEYPSYYQQLYRIIHSPSFLYLQHRETFCRLLDSSLTRNDLLPSHVVASFCKRLLRICLQAPPHGCLFCLSLVQHLLHQNPQIAVLVHRSSATNDNTELQMSDPFDPITDDPTATNALQSSAWELDALRHHSYAAVATLAGAVGQERQQQESSQDRQAYLQLTYTTLFEQERGQRKRRKTALEFVKPKGGLLWGNGDLLGDLIAQPKQSNNDEKNEGE